MHDFKDIDFRMIVAFDKNLAIGMDNKLLWSLPKDLKHFKNLTMGNVMLMGRKTYESIGKALPGRVSIVLTRDKNFKAPGCLVVNNLSEACDIMRNNYPDKILYCIGGANLYAQLLCYVEKLYVTEVDIKINKADSYFPKISERNWQEDLSFVEKHFKDEKHDYDFVFRKYASWRPEEDSNL